MRLRLIIAITIVLTLPYVYSLPCTEGACCKDEKILPKGTVCRQALNDCDVTENCTGVSSDCPPDIFATNFETFCWSGSEGGVCENGTCVTMEVVQNYETCQELCSAVRGKCTLKGECVCNDGWQSPPACDKKTGEENVEKDHKPNMIEMLEEQDEQVLIRNRRHVEENVFGSRIEEHDKMFSIQNPPQDNKDSFTRLKEHPLFIPVVIVSVGFIILLVFTISAKIFYQSELKAMLIQKRVKVEKTSSELPKNVSKIDDPAVNIDVGK